MTNAERMKLVPFPGILLLPTTEGSIWITASSITNISVVKADENIMMFPTLEPGKNYAVFNATDLASSVFVEIQDDQQMIEYVKIWARERTVK